MGRFIYISAFISSFILILTACKHDLKNTSVHFDRTAIHYGPVSKGKTVDFEYKIMNTGNEHLIISDIQSTCGCIGTDDNKVSIPPGKGSTLHFWFDTSYNSGNVEHEILLIGNFDSAYVRKLTFDANVIDVDI